MLSLKAILGLDGSGFELGLKRASSAADKFSKSVSSSLTSRLSGFLSVAAATSAANKIANFASEIKVTSDRLGVGIEELQQWEYAAAQSGARAASVTKFFEALAVTRERALGGDIGAQESLMKFGITNEMLAGNNLQTTGRAIGNAFKAGDQQKLIAALKDVGGKGGAELAAAFRSGLDELFANAPLIKTEDIIALEATSSQISAIGRELMAAFAPVVLFLGKAVADLWDDIRAIPVFLGTFMGFMGEGMGVKASLKAANDAVREIEDEAKRRDRAIQQAGEDARKPTGAGGSDTKAKSKGQSQIWKEPKKKDTSGEAFGLNLNSLQQMGAQISMSPLQTDMRTLAMEVRRTGLTLREYLNMKRQQGRGALLPPPGTEGNLSSSWVDRVRF